MKTSKILLVIILIIFSFSMSFIFLYIDKELSEAIESETVEVEKIVEKIVEKEIIKYVEIENTYNVTSVERELLARLVYREARGESFDTQVGVISIVFNRLKDGYWGDTIYDVIYAKGQFSVAGSLKNTTPNEASYRAVDYVLRYGSTLPDYVMYFRAGSFKYIPYICYEGDNTYFSYQERDMLKHIGNKGD